MSIYLNIVQHRTRNLWLFFEFYVKLKAIHCQPHTIFIYISISTVHVENIDAL